MHAGGRKLTSEIPKLIGHFPAFWDVCEKRRTYTGNANKNKIELSVEVKAVSNPKSDFWKILDKATLLAKESSEANGAAFYVESNVSFKDDLSKGNGQALKATSLHYFLLKEYPRNAARLNEKVFSNVEIKGIFEIQGSNLGATISEAFPQIVVRIPESATAKDFAFWDNPSEALIEEIDLMRNRNPFRSITQREMSFLDDAIKLKSCMYAEFFRNPVFKKEIPKRLSSLTRSIRGVLEKEEYREVATVYRSTSLNFGISVERYEPRDAWSARLKAVERQRHSKVIPVLVAFLFQANKDELDQLSKELSLPLFQI